MLPTSDEIIARLKAARNRQPSLDKGAVEAAFERHFRRLDLKPLPMRWYADAVEGYVAAACRAASWSNWNAAYENTTYQEVTYHPSVLFDAPGAVSFHLNLPVPEPIEAELFHRAHAAAWRGEESIVCRTVCLAAARRAYGSWEWAERLEPWKVVVYQTQYAANGAALCAVVLRMLSLNLPYAGLQTLWKLYKIWQPLMDAFEAGLWFYWVMKDEVLAVPRPVIHTQDGRLHSETGPAIHWPEGAQFWFYRGVQVTEQIILRPETLTLEQILKEPNVEVRRVMIERFGADRLLRETERVQTLNDSLWGTLYRMELPGDEPLVMVKVTCPSTGRKYFLRVPPTVRTAREAIAWTFDMQPRAYKPVNET